MKYVDEFRAPELISKAGEEIQKLTDRYIAEIEKILQTKEAELMAI